MENTLPQIEFSQYFKILSYRVWDVLISKDWCNSVKLAFIAKCNIFPQLSVKRNVKKKINKNTKVHYVLINNIHRLSTLLGTPVHLCRYPSSQVCDSITMYKNHVDKHQEIDLMQCNHTSDWGKWSLCLWGSFGAEGVIKLWYWLDNYINEHVYRHAY